MKNLTIILLLLILQVACTSQKSADDLVVAMELQFPPFETTDQLGNPAGISVEIAQDLAQNLGRNLQIRNTSWVGLIPTLQTGKADLILSSMSITEQRSQVVDFSVPYAKAGLTLLLHQDSAAQAFADLNQPQFTVAVKSGTIGALVAAERLPDAELRAFDDVATCVLEVAQGKADAFIYDALTVYENHQKHAETTKINLQTIEGTDQAWAIAVKKGNRELLEQVNNYIIQSRRNGRFETISQEYLGDLLQFFQENQIPSFWEVE
ncbi:MAG: transporter substrate-binding domain-containing protein [Candidatus Cloacimonadales bacterium]